ncbi:sporulation integral membrane protein YlbJ [Aciduricibacillus chroicocephali]|uniref:Sporulation integral membrane protein YlbJ n=1 Tax=Aciduricibacillus chroicocephali TaxID=3054939 RepID=A0ABY9KZ52_9BACI|nr:sporulation integral membrane protein YlbJ [Bacillaceae bacterium 44XB]
MKQILHTLLFAGATSFIALGLITFPDQAVGASIHGLNMWWEIVFPSLLPFFITAELLISFGVVRFLGVLFEPVMRPLFRVPGAGSFGWIMGMASGYPTGAKIAVRLREEKQLTRIEAERLVCFTNASSPLFIFGAVSIGFFHDSKLGILLAISHYAGNAIVGICMRFYGHKEERNTTSKQTKKSGMPLLRALREMHRTRLREKRPLGEIASTAVINSIKTLVMVGGFIILFSVLTKLLYLTGITPVIASILTIILEMLSLPGELGLPIMSGMFEITLGSQMISQLALDDMFGMAIAVSFILGFNGFSIQSQVASILAKSDIRFKPYFFARILHGIIAASLTFLLYKPLYLNRQVFDYQHFPVTETVFSEQVNDLIEVTAIAGPILTIGCLALAAYLMLVQILKTKKNSA